MMKKKFKIVCKACNSVYGYSEEPIIENLNAKCPSCGMERISVEPVPEIILQSMDFDLFITNKRTGVTKKSGYNISLDDLKKTPELKEMFIEKSAKALAELLKSESITVLLKNTN